ncbi:GerAB/ArcD/ProY family transporter [Clostridium magnum]|uniref:Spore germination protein YndE n=1 Tax=Clostridium magnum DSM 2767 TaxID=1121326 RepID=A0A162TAN9_9CLOT|nr:endospore germination permease [Clostridium magnum]KZL92414.1 spore germination protein YndE [Clostridium magnum DSM 2767]SHH10286.1 spore germination protein KB [Clostridium magnum DSM 2767]
MTSDKKISKIQLFLLIIGFLYSNTVIINPVREALQDAWIAYIIAWAGGFISLSVYLVIAKLNPYKTLIQILVEVFGKIIGSGVAGLYIWYFIHMAAVVLRDFGEYIITTEFPETPIVFVMGSFCLIIAFALRKSIEVIARTNELIMLVLPLFILFLIFANVQSFEFKNLQPVLEKGITFVLKPAFSAFSFPFAELVVFLMIFPYLNQQEKLAKTSYLAFAVGGFSIFLSIMKDFIVLGPDMVMRTYFPPNVSVELVPNISLVPLISANLMITGGVKIVISAYAAISGITQLFNLDDSKVLVFPIISLIVILSVWLYDNIFDSMRWGAEIWPYYSIPFQIVFPILILIISFVRHRKRNCL